MNDNTKIAICVSVGIAGILMVIVGAVWKGSQGPKPSREIQVPTQADIAAVEGAKAEARPAAELETLVSRLQRDLASFQARNAELEKDLAGYRQAHNPVAKEIGLWLNRHAAQHDQERQALRTWISEVQAGLRSVKAKQDAEAAAKILTEALQKAFQD